MLGSIRPGAEGHPQARPGTAPQEADEVPRLEAERVSHSEIAVKDQDDALTPAEKTPASSSSPAQGA
jgi:hypothetical protein